MVAGQDALGIGVGQDALPLGQAAANPDEVIDRRSGSVGRGSDLRRGRRSAPEFPKTGGRCRSIQVPPDDQLAARPAPGPSQRRGKLQGAQVITLRSGQVGQVQIQDADLTPGAVHRHRHPLAVPGV